MSSQQSTCNLSTGEKTSKASKLRDYLTRSKTSVGKPHDVLMATRARKAKNSRNYRARKRTRKNASILRDETSSEDDEAYDEIEERAKTRSEYSETSKAELDISNLPTENSENGFLIKTESRTDFNTMKYTDLIPAKIESYPPVQESIAVIRPPSPILIDPSNHSMTKKICRLCSDLKSEVLLIQIHGSFYQQLLRKLQPFGVSSEEDKSLPKHVCRSCGAKLVICIETLEKFIETEKLLITSGDYAKMHTMCRLCSGLKHAGSLIPIYMSIHKLLLGRLKPFGISLREDLPPQICMSCAARLLICIETLDQFVDSERKLKKMGPRNMKTVCGRDGLPKEIIEINVNGSSIIPISSTQKVSQSIILPEMKSEPISSLPEVKSSRVEGMETSEEIVSDNSETEKIIIEDGIGGMTDIENVFTIVRRNEENESILPPNQSCSILGGRNVQPVGNMQTSEESFGVDIKTEEVIIVDDADDFINSESILPTVEQEMVDESIDHLNPLEIPHQQPVEFIEVSKEKSPELIQDYNFQLGEVRPSSSSVEDDDPLSEKFRISCRQCHRVFVAREFLIRHTQKEHPNKRVCYYKPKTRNPSKARHYQCQFCDMIITSSIGFYAHLKSHVSRNPGIELSKVTTEAFPTVHAREVHKKIKMSEVGNQSPETNSDNGSKIC